MVAPALENGLDRRRQRTRSAVLAAFNRLVTERAYASLTPAEIAASADIGRSTFYEHFRGIDDVLAKSLQALFVTLADACFQDNPSDDAQRVIEHIWQKRRLAQELFNGETHAIVLKSFTAAFALSIERSLRATGAKPILAPNLIAVVLATSQLALVAAWVSGRSGHSAHDITHALHASGHASALALMAHPVK